MEVLIMFLVLLLCVSIFLCVFHLLFRLNNFIFMLKIFVLLFSLLVLIMLFSKVGLPTSS
jgi:hypothetical protein